MANPSTENAGYTTLSA